MMASLGALLYPTRSASAATADPDDADASYAQLREQHHRLTLLLELTNALVSHLDLRDVLTAVMRGAQRVMRSSSAVVALPDPDSQRLRAYALDGSGGPDLRETELLDGEAILATQVFRTGQPWVGRSLEVGANGLAVILPVMDSKPSTTAAPAAASGNRRWNAPNIRCAPNPMVTIIGTVPSQKTNMMSMASRTCPVPPAVATNT